MDLRYRPDALPPDFEGDRGGGQPVVTGWRTYARLEDPPDSETFTVYLNDAGSRMIRSWRHAADCAQCNEHLTTAMSLDEGPSRHRRLSG